MYVRLAKSKKNIFVKITVKIIVLPCKKFKFTQCNDISVNLQCYFNKWPLDDDKVCALKMPVLGENH